MDRKQFIEALRTDLIARGFPEAVVSDEMISVASYFDDNNITDVPVPVKEMADEIAEMLSESPASRDGDDDAGAAPGQPADSAQSGDDDDITPTRAEDDIIPSAVSIEDEIEDALRTIDSGSVPAGDDRPDGGPAVADEASDPRADGKDSADAGLAGRSGEGADGADDADASAARTDPAADERRDASPSEPADERRTVQPPPVRTDDEDEDMMIFAGPSERKAPEPIADDIDYIDSGEDVDDFSPSASGKGGRKGKKKKAEQTPSQLTDASDYDSDEANNYDSRIDDFLHGYESNKVLFWVVFAVALPVIIALALLMVALYMGFWIVLALLMIGIVAGLIIFVTAGVLVSLIGIVYGAIQLVKGAIPVGLFETGLGVTVGAAVMFVGILVYNIAIRLIPFAMKSLAKLLAFAFRKAKDGFVALKGVLDKI
jgi:hypothetical protein